MATILFKWLISALLMLNTSNHLHPYYVSVVELRNNRNNKMIELTCRFFTDDFESALKNEGFPSIDLIHPSNRHAADQYIFSYITNHLKISVNGRVCSFEYVGYEVKEDAVNSYLQFPFSGQFQQVQVTSDLLYREHPEQSGIYHFVEGKKRESRRLINPDRNLDVRF